VDIDILITPTIYHIVPFGQDPMIAYIPAGLNNQIKSLGSI